MKQLGGNLSGEAVLISGTVIRDLAHFVLTVTLEKGSIIISSVRCSESHCWKAVESRFDPGLLGEPWQDFTLLAQTLSHMPTLALSLVRDIRV